MMWLMYSVCTGLKQLYLLVDYKVFLHSVQLHVSALDNVQCVCVCAYWSDTAVFIGRI